MAFALSEFLLLAWDSMARHRTARPGTARQGRTAVSSDLSVAGQYALGDNLMSLLVFLELLRCDACSELPDVFGVHLREECLRVEGLLDDIDLHGEEGLRCVLEREQRVPRQEPR